VSLASHAIATPEQLQDVLDGLSAGQRVAVVVERDGQPETTEVELADWALHPIVVAGMTLRPLSGTGGEVVAVRPRSRAERAGIRIGDVVRAVGGIPVQAPADVQQAITMGRSPIEVLRDGSPIVVRWPDPG
jgi:S1-C subfamily serine protease